MAWPPILRSFSRKSGALPVGWIGCERLLESLDRSFALARLLPRITEIEPARREAGREFQRLPQQVDRSRNVALGTIGARHLVAAIGQYVA